MTQNGIQTMSIIGQLMLLALLAVLGACETKSVSPLTTGLPSTATTALVSPATQQPIDVKVGLLNIAGDIGIYTALERGYFAEEGIQVELVPFRSGQEQIPMLATAQIQFGTASLDVSLLNAVARDINLHIIQDKGKPSIYQGAGVVVRADLYANGTLDEVAKLKGRTIGLSVFGNTSHMFLETALQRAGISIDDVSLITLPVSNMPAALANGALDAAWMFEPFTAQTIMSGAGRMLIDSSEIAPHFYSQFLLVAEQFAQQNPGAVCRFVTAHLRGQRDYYRAFISGERVDDREILISYMRKYTAIKDRTIYDWMGYSAVDPNGYVDPTVLEEFQDWAVQKGYLSQRVDIRRLVDRRYMQCAIERLGLYH